MKKVILISVDGMRPDGFLNCGNPYIHTLMKESMSALNGQTVFPSVTLPCHISMFHSVPPQRHGILTNTYVPQVRPVSGLFEQINLAGGTSAFFYGWEQLRDIGRPGSLKHASYISALAAEGVDEILTDRALTCIREYHPDFVFLYLVDVDEHGGHGAGWMSERYLQCISTAVSCIKKVIEECGEEYSVVITADHGGHDRTHGSEMPEDMTIPIFFRGKEFPAGTVAENVSILDIAPTIAKMLGVPASPDWEGKALC